MKDKQSTRIPDSREWFEKLNVGRMRLEWSWRRNVCKAARYDMINGFGTFNIHQGSWLPLLHLVLSPALKTTTHNIKHCEDALYIDTNSKDDSLILDCTLKISDIRWISQFLVSFGPHLVA
jgi:hypothetical protein